MILNFSILLLIIELLPFCTYMKLLDTRRLIFIHIDHLYLVTATLFHLEQDAPHQREGLLIYIPKLNINVGNYSAKQVKMKTNPVNIRNICNY